MRKATGNGAARFPPETERTLLGARAQVGSTKHPFHSGWGGSDGTPKSLRTPRAPTPVLGFPRPAPSSQGTVSALILQRRLQTSTLAPNSGTDTVPFTDIFLLPSSSSHSSYGRVAHNSSSGTSRPSASSSTTPRYCPSSRPLNMPPLLTSRRCWSQPT